MFPTRVWTYEMQMHPEQLGRKSQRVQKVSGQARLQLPRNKKSEKSHQRRHVRTVNLDLRLASTEFLVWHITYLIYLLKQARCKLHVVSQRSFNVFCITTERLGKLKQETSLSVLVCVAFRWLHSHKIGVRVDVWGREWYKSAILIASYGFPIPHNAFWTSTCNNDC